MQRHITKTVLLLTVTLGLTYCGGGSQEPDPVIVDYPIAYIARDITLLDDNGNPIAPQFNYLEPAQFLPGARVLLQARAAINADVIDITSSVFASDQDNTPEASTTTQRPLYDVKDLTVSPDGSKLAFAMRAPEIENANDDEQPTWNIWQYDLNSANLTRIITSDTIAEEGQDVAPQYLPNERLVFSSTRQRRSRAILLDEGKPQFAGQTEDRQQDAFNLHTMALDGTDIEQISFNQNHDLMPWVLEDGRIVFNRWDNTNRRNRVSLFTINPDGTNLSLLYGYHSQMTGTNDAENLLIRIRELALGELLVSQVLNNNSVIGGDLTRIDVADFTDINHPTAQNVSTQGPAQSSVTNQAIPTDGSISGAGQYFSSWPFYDGTDRMLVSWGQCRLQDSTSSEPRIIPCQGQDLNSTEVTRAPDLYGLWIYDLANNTQQPVLIPEEGTAFMEGVILSPRTRPEYNPQILDPALAEAELGALHIRSVYDLDGTDVSPFGISAMSDPLQTTSADRPARFIKIVKASPMPDRDTLNFPGSAFGQSSGQLMREIIGYAPIEPDGSTMVKIPAQIPFFISVVDAQGQRISQRHNHWLQLAPGETRHCNGCHTRESELPHGRQDAQAASVNLGALGESFPNTNPIYPVEVGDSMAQAYARRNGARELTVDLVFEDEWTAPGSREPDANISLRYADLTTQAPVTSNCLTLWDTLCRTTPHYPEHIQPLWDLDRSEFDSAGNLTSNKTCTRCHARIDSDGLPMLPEASLDLSDSPSTQPGQTDFFISYSHLFRNRLELELDDEGNVITREELVLDENGDPIPVLDLEGNPILDADENPIFETQTFNLTPSMNVAGARRSARFFSLIQQDSDHQLSEAELRLIAEWLDIGAQYYNNPFSAPSN